MTDPGDQIVPKTQPDSTDPNQNTLWIGGGSEKVHEWDGNPALARSADPETSKDAARRVDVTKREREALEGLRRLGGSGTSTEIAEVMGADKWSISPRMKPLEDKGELRRTDERRNKQIVWELL